MVRVFSLSEDKPDPSLTLEDIRTYLIERIQELLDRNMGLLMSALYRIDVSEASVKHIFATVPPGGLGPALADLIIKRQIQKIHIRERYKAEPPDSPFEV